MKKYEIQTNKKGVLFLGIHNAAKSQMAEGLLNSLKGEYYEALVRETLPAL